MILIEGSRIIQQAYIAKVKLKVSNKIVSARALLQTIQMLTRFVT